jgi:hypothetical protein
MIDVKRAVINQFEVTYLYYKDRQLWYTTEFAEVFPVPIEDLGTATLYPKEKAIFFMRYMNKYNKELADA